MAGLQSDADAIKKIVEKIEGAGNEHLTQKEILDYYEGESRHIEQIFNHLGRCRECHDKYILFAEDRFQKDLDIVKNSGILILFL